MDVASFLLNCTSTLPNAEEISAQLLGGGGDDDNYDDDDDDEKMGDVSDENNAEDAKPAAAPAAATEPNSADPQPYLLQSIQSSQPHPTFTNNNEHEVSCINPRGKFLLSIFKNGIILTNPKKQNEEQIPISPSNVRNVIWFRKPEDYKKVKQLNENGISGKGKNKGIPGHMVLICLEEETADDGSSDHEGITFRNKPLKQVCLQLPAYPPPSSAEDSNDDNSNAQLTEEDWWNGLSSALFSGTNNGIIRVHTTIDKPAYSKGTPGFVFQSEGEPGSTTTTEGMPYVGCYQGFNDGALFPLREGLLFFKPPLFVPRSKLASISCGRGSGGSRYVDMVVQLDNSSYNSLDEQEGKKKKKKQSDSLEFTNIHRDELTGLNDFIHQTLIPAMQMDADGMDGDSSEDDDHDDDADVAVAEVVNTSDDGAEESNSGSDNEEQDGSERKRRPSRAASKSAREITRAALKSAPEAEDEDDSDDSEDFQEGDESDGSEDESVVSDGESEASSEDGGFEEEEEMDDSDGSDYANGRNMKKARVE
eukprot:CAMPEP_0172328916 /NCGR_PEP_ID=MMETSP1058-20130122/60603_1 /TAXON_ID=83371 /ORGANISM="Detonula confervacea, Strain CCMP 353" /LENGTH=534 /DNA_ID=CAMNT_0013046053 /DNA_START=505 /DNA_END=2109 /DNA_ORIENTATION=-